MKTSVRLVVLALAATACVFPDMPTTPTPTEPPAELVDTDGGISVEEYAAQLERAQELRREYERLKEKTEDQKAEIAELEKDLKERRESALQRHLEKPSIAESWVMFVVAVTLAVLVSWVVDRRRR